MAFAESIDKPSMERESVCPTSEHIKKLKLIYHKEAGPGYINVFEDSLGYIYHIYSKNTNENKREIKRGKALQTNKYYWIALHGYLRETIGRPIYRHKDADIPQHIIYQDDNFTVSSLFDGDCYYASNIEGRYVYPLSLQDSLPMFKYMGTDSIRKCQNMEIRSNHPPLTFHTKEVRDQESDSSKSSDIKQLKLKDYWKVNDWIIFSFADEKGEYYGASLDTLASPPVQDAEPLEIGKQYTIKIAHDIMKYGDVPSRALEVSGGMKRSSKLPNRVKLKNFRVLISRPQNNRGEPGNIIGRWVTPVEPD